MKEWLSHIGLEKYLPLFEENEITPDDLPDITNDDLKDIGITSLPHRKQILKAIEEGQGPQLDESEALIIEKYPYLLAYPFDEMLRQDNPFLKIQLLKDVFLNVLKYLGLITATEYLRSDFRSRTINQLFREKLYQPQFGHWNHFIRETLVFLNEQNHSFLVPELSEAYYALEVQKKAPRYSLEIQYTDDFGEIQTVKQDVTAISGLINFRNRYIGHSVTLSDHKSNEVFETYFPILKDLLRAIDFCVKYPMIKFNEGQSWLLHGCTIKPTENIIEAPGEHQSLWLQISEEKQMPLIPFLILPKKYIAGVLDNVEMFVYEQFTGKRIVYFSPEKEKGETAGEVVRILNEMLEMKSREVPVSISDISFEKLKAVFAETSENHINDLTRERKVVEGIYQPREENELNLRNFVKGRQPVYFLAAEAGSGKTNLLAEMYRQFGQQMQHTSLLIRAIRMQSSQLESELKHILNIIPDDDLAASNLLKTDPENPIVILIDGMNEHTEPEVLLESTMQFVKKANNPGLKVVISWRINSPDDYPRLDNHYEPLLYNGGQREVAADSQVNILMTYAGLLQPLNRIELGKAWEFYAKHKSKQFKPRFALEDLELRNREFSKQLSNPLLLRIFMELFSNKPLPKTQQALHIWNNWYRQLEEQVPGAQQILEQIALEMMKQAKTVLDIDTLYDHPLLGQQLRDLSIDNPYQKLIIRGVLSQYFKGGFPVLSFTIEAAYHYVLSRIIQKDPNIKRGTHLIDAMEKHASLKGIREAVGECLLEDVANNQYQRLKEIISISDDHKDVTAKPLAMAFMAGPANMLVNDLMAASPLNALEAILEADFVLEKNIEELKRLEVSSAMTEEIRKINPGDQLLSRVLERHEAIKYMSGYYQDSLDLSFEILKLREKFLQPDDPLLAASYNKISISYRKLKNLDDSLTYALKAREIREKILPDDHMDLALSYDNLAKVYEKRREFSKSLDIANRLIAIYEKKLHPFHPLLSRVLNDTAITYRENGEKEKSMQTSFRAIDIAEKSLDPNHYQRAYCFWTLSETYFKFGEYKNALDYMKRNFEILLKNFPPEHPNCRLAAETVAMMEARVKEEEEKEN